MIHLGIAFLLGMIAGLAPLVAVTVWMAEKLREANWHHDKAYWYYKEAERRQECTRVTPLRGPAE